jgi:hypothetical protein
MFDRSLAIFHRSLPVLLAVGALAASGVASADSDLKKSYSGLNCDSLYTGRGHKAPSGYSVQAGTDEVTCPIDRDGTQVTKLPQVLVETYNAVKPPPDGVTDMQCYVTWLQEDQSTDSYRGMAVHQTATKAGPFQFSFDSLEEYFLGIGEMSLSSGGEGTMSLTCHNLREGDRIIQYYASENVY